MKLFRRVLLACASVVLGVCRAWRCCPRPRRGPGACRCRLRPAGRRLRQIVVKSGDPADCSLRCERDGRCRSWSFAYPRTQQIEAVCWLKKNVPPRVENQCCVSGVRGAGVNEPISKDLEFGIDRAGADYRSFETPADSSGARLRPGLQGANSVAAPGPMSRPGYPGPAAHCYLKAKVTLPRRQAVLHVGRCPIIAPRQGSVAKRMRPVGFSVLMSKVRNSAAPSMSISTAMPAGRSDGRQHMRAFRQGDDAVAGYHGGAGEHPIADDGHHRGYRKRRGQRRNHHHDARPADELRRGGFGPSAAPDKLPRGLPDRLVITQRP